MREHLRFIQQSNRRDMQDHESGMSPGVGGEEWRESFARVGIHEPIGPTFANTHEIGHSYRPVIEGKSERRPGKIAAGKNVGGTSKSQGVTHGRRRFKL